METALLVIGIFGLIPVAYLIYTRFIRKPLFIDVEIGDVALVRVESPTRSRNGKLALIFCSLALVNTGPTARTLKKVSLEYRFEGKRQRAELIAIPTGTVDGVRAIALANATEQIIIGWANLGEALASNTPLPEGGVLRGGAVCLLSVPLPRFRDVADCALVVRDYSGGHSTQEFVPEPGWFQAHTKGFSLMDAPVAKTGGEIHWHGISVTTRKPI